MFKIYPLKRQLSFTLIIMIMALLPAISIKAAIITPVVDAKSAIVIDEQTGQVIAEKNGHQRLPIASTSKLLVAYLVEQQIKTHKMDDTSLVSITPAIAKMSQAPGLTNVPLSSHQQYTVHELLEDALLPSGNAAAIALGIKVTGSLAKTNQAMEHLLTHFGIASASIYSPAGLRNGDMGDLKSNKWSTDAENKLSARELSLVAKHLMTDFPQIRTITSCAATTTKGIDNTPYPLHNTNKLLNNPRTSFVFTGIKTGSSPSVGGNFVGETTLDGRRVITVTLGSGLFTDDRTRFIETISMLTQVEQGAKVVQIPRKTKSITVLVAKTGQVQTEANKQLAFFAKKSDTPKIKLKNTHYRQSISTNAPTHTYLGQACVNFTAQGTNFVDGTPSVKLRSTQPLKPASWVTRHWRSLFSSHDYQISKVN